jgi:hypothetical protein
VLMRCVGRHCRGPRRVRQEGQAREAPPRHLTHVVRGDGPQCIQAGDDHHRHSVGSAPERHPTTPRTRRLDGLPDAWVDMPDLMRTRHQSCRCDQPILCCNSAIGVCFSSQRLGIPARLKTMAPAPYGQCPRLFHRRTSPRYGNVVDAAARAGDDPLTMSRRIAKA